MGVTVLRTYVFSSSLDLMFRLDILGINYVLSNRIVGDKYVESCVNFCTINALKTHLAELEPEL